MNTFILLIIYFCLNIQSFNKQKLCLLGALIGISIIARYTAVFILFFVIIYVYYNSKILKGENWISYLKKISILIFFIPIGIFLVDPSLILSFKDQISFINN